MRTYRGNQKEVTIFLLEAYFLGLVGLWPICAAVKEDHNLTKSVRCAFTDLIKEIIHYLCHADL